MRREGLLLVPAMKIENGKIVSNDPSTLADQMEVARFQRWIANGRKISAETPEYLGLTPNEHAALVAKEQEPSGEGE